MRYFLLSVLGTLVGILIFVFLFFIFIAGLIGATSNSKPVVTGEVLSLDIRGGIIDHSAGESVFGNTPNSVVEIVRALDAAKDDEDIKGLFIRANGYGMTPASAEELRLAIKDFQSEDKFVIAHSQGFEGTSFTAYHAVSTADEIWLQDTTPFAVAGIRSEIPFYGGIAEKYGAKVDMVQFHEYKNAANVYKESGFTDAHREATTGLLTSLYDTAVTQIAEDRQMSAEKIRSLFESAPHSAESAKKAGLIDKLGHLIDAQEYAKEKAGDKDSKFMSLSAYADTLETGTGPVIALIGGQGPVVMGSSSNGNSPFSSDITMGGDTVSGAFESAIKDKKVKAIVFRVSTPGGSATASDQIHNATLRAKEAGKPVIVSMGQYAASGGYYVSTHADKIVAMPSTITGSIGVLGGKIALRDTYARFGFNVESVDIGGEYVGIYSGDEPFTQAQRAAYTEQMGDIYKDFTGKVADGRNIPIETVLEIAKGRVWTGEQAKQRGLVDELGGLMTAIELAKASIELEEDDTIRLKQYPRPKTAQEQLMEMLGGSVQSQQDLARLRALLDSPEMQMLLEAKDNLDNEQKLKAILPRIK